MPSGRPKHRPNFSASWMVASMLDCDGLKLAPVDYLILALYVAFVLGIGWLVKRGFSDDEIRKLVGGNTLRVLEQVWA